MTVYVEQIYDKRVDLNRFLYQITPKRADSISFNFRQVFFLNDGETTEIRTSEKRTPQKTEQSFRSKIFCTLFYIEKPLWIPNTERLFWSGNVKFQSILPLKTEHASGLKHGTNINPNQACAMCLFDRCKPWWGCLKC